MRQVHFLEKIQVATGGNHTCALDSLGSAYFWGRASFGRIGDGTTTGNVTSPVKINMNGVLSGLKIKKIFVGNSNSCVIASDDKAYCWGQGSVGRLGNSSTSDQENPVAVTTSGVLSGLTIKDIDAGVNHTCVVASNDRPYCWGNQASGALGSGNSSGTASSPVAVNMAGALSGLSVIQVATGSSHSCALASNNQVYCWGSATGGKLGDGTTSGSSTTPVKSLGALVGKTISKISLGLSHSCSTDNENNLYCWGSNANGQLGIGNKVDKNLPIFIYSLN